MNVSSVYARMYVQYVHYIKRCRAVCSMAVFVGVIPARACLLSVQRDTSSIVCVYGLCVCLDV